jgi:hypothetical protein
MITALLAYHHYSRSGSGGFSEIARIAAHAVVWSVVSRFIYSAPGVGVVVALVLAAGYLLIARRRRGVAARSHSSDRRD